MKQCNDTVDGQNPAPPRMMIPLFLGFQPSQVVQDFFHQQYVHVSSNSGRLRLKAIGSFQQPKPTHIKISRSRCLSDAITDGRQLKTDG